MDCGLCRSIPCRARVPQAQAGSRERRSAARAGRPARRGNGTTMSGPDEADRDKGFLARWSQRKQEAKQPEPKPDAPAAESVESPGSHAPQGEDVTPEFDLSTLPKLEELTASTDITAFLRKGVPEHLRNAALQKSWALDPEIG